MFLQTFAVRELLRCSAIGLALIFLSAVRAEPSSVPPELLDDAELAAVTFVNSDQGWAVGDRGVIRHTDDGGRTWRQQLSPVGCRLEAIQFLNPETGWAVGGWTHPYTHRTSGVVLRTRDGGAQWTQVPGLMLPGLRFVRFLDSKQGWAAGDRSAMYPTGVFWTDDGGRTWVPVLKGRSPGWISIDLSNDGRLILAGADGSVAEATRQEIRILQPAATETERTRRIHASTRGMLWRVGDGGAAAVSEDGGRTWSPPSAATTSALKGFDFRAVATLGTHTWIAGAPGTFVFHSQDGGKTWDKFATEQFPPLRAMTFIDEQRGWAVGAFGTILATKDGGRSWRVQQQGGTRAALMCVFADAQRVPWEWPAQCSGNDGYRSVLELIGRDAALSPHVSGGRAHEALVAVGGSNAEQAWSFPVPRCEGTGKLQNCPTKIEDIVLAWNASNEGEGVARLEEYLVRRIRQWRPDVILTDDASPRGDDAVAHLTNQIVLSAVRKAADAAEFPSMTDRLALPPWRVRKVAGRLPQDRRGAITLTTSQLAPRLGRSVSELAEGGRALLVDRYEPAPALLSAGLLIDHLPQGIGRQDLMSGMAIRAGSDARRQLGEAIGGSLDALARMTQRRHNVQQMIARSQLDSPQAATWLGQVNELTQGMGDRAAGDVLYQLAMRYDQAGKRELAADALAMLVERRSQHPLAESAALWLVRYYASGEAAWRLREDQKFGVQVTTFETPAGATPSPVDASPEEAEKPSPAPTVNVQAVQQGMSTAHGQRAERAARAIAVGKFLERSQPSLAAEPMLKLPLAAALRNQGPGRTQEKAGANGPPPADDPWAKPFAAEQWLTQPRLEPPVPVVRVARAAKAPVLDGKLDEELWQTARGTTIPPAGRGGTGESPAVSIVLARDDQYLYVAASCRRLAGCDYALDARPRTHDADLKSADRLEISLDIDRDYTTAYRLIADHAGRIAADCWDDAGWNPTWYVAADGNEEFWTLEAAIPWEELTGRPPQAREAWAIDVARIAPGSGRKSLTGGASNSPARFGLLMFE